MLHQLLVSIRKPFIKMAPIPTPKIESGAGSLEKLAQLCERSCMVKPMVVTDSVLTELGLVDRVTEQLDKAGISYALFNQVTPNPDFDLVRKGVSFFKDNNCDGVIGFGGGSPIDCAKAVSASAKTGKDISKLMGVLRVHRPVYPIIAIPTTAGSGSEATVAAVISDPVTRTKPNITDLFITPKSCVLDPTLMVGLPPEITADTGIDALTHAVEAYLSQYSGKAARAKSLGAIKAIFEYLPRAYQQGDDLVAREKLAQASFDAGWVLTRNYLGYVHAFAHQLGGFYHVPHGRANGIVMPKVLRFTAEQNPQPVAQLARELSLSRDKDEYKCAMAFVTYMEAFLAEFSVPTYVDALIESEIPQLAKLAMKEVHCEYPVPAYMDKAQCEALILSLMPIKDAA